VLEYYLSIAHLQVKDASKWTSLAEGEKQEQIKVQRKKGGMFFVQPPLIDKVSLL